MILGHIGEAFSMFHRRLSMTRGGVRQGLVTMGSAVLASGVCALGDSYTVTIEPGANAIANQLDFGANTLTEILPNVPAGTEFWKWNSASQTYAAPSTFSTRGGWGAGGVTLNPGEGGFLVNRSGAPFDVTFLGTRRTPSLPVALQQDLQIVSRQTPEIGTFENITGYSPQGCSHFELFRFTGGADQSDPQSVWTGFSYENNAWHPEPPQLDVGESVFLKMEGSCTGEVTFAVFGTKPVVLGSCSNVQLAAYGGGFPAGAALKLVQGTNSIDARSEVEIAPGYIISGEFDLSEVGITVGAMGLWDVTVEGPGATPAATLAGGVSVVSCTGEPDLFLGTRAPANIAVGRGATFSLWYENAGYAATATSVFFTVTGIPGADQVEVDLSGTYPACVVEPDGAGQKIVSTEPIDIAPGEGGTLDFRLKILPEAATAMRSEGTESDSEPPFQQQEPLTGFRLGVRAYTFAWNEALAMYEISFRVGVVWSLDPNDKLGPVGIGPERSITGEFPMSYQIRFENATNATAPAQEVFVTDQLDTDRYDLGTVSLGPIAFGAHTSTPPAGVQAYSNDVPFDVDGNPGTTNDNIIVRIEADVVTNPTRADYGLLSCSLRSIDPVTGQLPDDPFRGFLPPNYEPPEGDGSVSFTIHAKSNLATGDTITNDAVIVFDVNPPIRAPAWTNTIDRTPRLAILRNGDHDRVSWSGSGTLQVTDEFDTNTWVDIPEAFSPYTGPAAEAKRFYRLRQ